MTIRPFKTGACRGQSSLLPPRIEDYVGPDNPVRVIEAYVSMLDLAALGFRHADRDGGAGQPPYDPADLLKLYLYGYLNQARSSRRLAREAVRNVEVMWLLKGLEPGYRTIGDFRKDNIAALKAANRDFVLVLHELELLGGDLVAIDGAFFHGDASKASIVTRKRLAAQVAVLEQDIAAYAAALEANDAAEADTVEPADGEAAQKLAALMAKRAAAQADLAQLTETGETQLSRTDADARLLKKHGQTVAGYNAQVAIDAKHKLIVASEVVNDGNDTGQLHAVADAAKQALGVETLTVLAERLLQWRDAEGLRGGWHHRLCPAAAAERTTGRAGPVQPRGVPLRRRCRCLSLSGGSAAAADERAQGRRERQAVHLYVALYVSRKSDCGTCPLRGRCLSDKADRRTIYRWEHEDVLERHRARMADAAELMRRRSALAEHPFGTLKCRAGYRHFLLRGFDKVRGEWSLMALCYNLSRVAAVVGIGPLIAYLAKPAAQFVLLLLWRVIAAVMDRIRQLQTVIWRVPARFGAFVRPSPGYPAW